MSLSRISEENGSICCYRIFMVRLLPHSDWKNLPSPKDVSIVDYEEAHGVQPMLGAYVTDVFSNERFPSEHELVMGDQRSVYNRDEPVFARDACRRCVRRPKRGYDIPPPRTTTTAAPTTTAPTTRDDYFEDDQFTTEDPDESTRERRSYLDRDYKQNPMMMDKLVNEEDRDEFIVKDGLLDPTSNYTAFVELISGSEEDEPMYSEYLNVLMPAMPPAPTKYSPTLETALFLNLN